MAATATPMGAEPVGCLSSNGSFTGKVRHYKIASGYGTAIFYGDFVKLVSSGTVEKDTGTTACTPVGVFVGVSYTDPNTMKMQSDQSIAQTGLGNNAAVVQTAGSTSIGRSKNAVDGSTIATTNTLPVKIIEFVEGPDSAVGDSFTDVIVVFNAGHQLTNTTGV